MDERVRAPRQGHQSERHLPLILGLLVGCAAYVLSHWLPVPLLCYLPERQVWALAPAPGPIAMSYYGIVLYGLAGFGIGFAAGKSAVARRLAEGSRAVMLTLGACAMLFGALTYFAVVELVEWGGH